MVHARHTTCPSDFTMYLLLSLSIKPCFSRIASRSSTHSRTDAMTRGRMWGEPEGMEIMGGAAGKEKHSPNPNPNPKYKTQTQNPNSTD